MSSARTIEAILGSTAAREVARLEEQRAAWVNASSAKDIVEKQLREFTENSALMQAKAMQSAAMTLGQQYKDLMESGSTAKAMRQALEASERAQATQMRKMFDSMADIRKSLVDAGGSHLRGTEFLGIDAGSAGLAQLVKEMSGVGAVAAMLAKEAEESRARTKRLLEDVGIGSSARRIAEEFERINRQWRVPGEALGMGEVLRHVQEQLRASTALPTIDWGTATALARAMGPVGLEHQLALLGIAPDGSMEQPSTQPERGILSRKQNEAIALVSLLLTLLIFFYQEYNNAQQQAKTDAIQAEQSAKLDAQARQLEGLAALIQKSLAQTAQSHEERFFVRSRPAPVRRKPQQGAAVDGQLMPNEVVRAIDKDGKWVEVEYYHWLHEEYRTGWVLKKYLERVPANYSAGSK